jgi:hypothetical protein
MAVSLRSPQTGGQGSERPRSGNEFVDEKKIDEKQNDDDGQN